MNVRSDEFNIKFLSTVSYLGPLFFMAKFSAEQNQSDVKFHCKRGQHLFILFVCLYVFDILIYELLMETIPTVATSVFYLFLGLISVAWLFATLHGIYCAVKSKKNYIPFGLFKL